MKKIYYEIGFLVLTVFIVFCYKVQSFAHATFSSEWQSVVEKARKIRYQNPKEAIALLQANYEERLIEKDTAAAVQMLLEVATIYGHQAKYKEAYDQLWHALFLSDAAEIDSLKSDVLLDIGKYYSFYKRKDKALTYFERALAIKKNLVNQGDLTPARLVEHYYIYCSTFRDFNEPELGQNYLDSCFLHYDSTLSKPHLSFLQFEQAYLLSKNQKYQEALELFETIVPWMKQNKPSYQVLLYTYMGDNFMEMKHYEESIKYYEMALDISALYNGHIDFTPLIHQNLSVALKHQQKYAEAYEQLELANQLSDKFFDSRSLNNAPLLEIQDAYREQQKKQEHLLQQQKLAQLEQEERVFWLQRILLIGCLCFLLLFGYLYLKYVRSKHKAEKGLLQKKRELEVQKANEIVELKNKELTTSTLKLIEKDEALRALQERLEKGSTKVDFQEIRKTVNSIVGDNASNWKVFEARFVDVNKDFYKRLKKQFPNLTQNDQKLCALVKLDFSSKDIASLLGISVESVHTTRYRLRKKLKLSRDINLKEFIAGI
ncbi:MAG: hypothetical protein AAF806_28120 [Bacteroidota bacterium]